MRGKDRLGLVLSALLIAFLSSATVSPVNAEIVLFKQGRLASGWTIGTDSHKEKSSRSTCAASVAAEDFDLNAQESFYLQKLENSKKKLYGKDAILIELESCDSDILEALTFSPRFDGTLGRHALPQIPMADYKLNESQQNSSSSYAFLFPMSYLDSVWRNETFDRLTIRCAASDSKCQLALTYAAIIPATEIKELLTARFMASDPEDQQFQPSPLPPGQPLFYWICSIFPFFWCPPPAPAPVLPPPQLPDPFPLDPEEPDDDYDYGDDDDEYDDGDDDDYDYEDDDSGVRSYLLQNGNYDVYARPGEVQRREKMVTVYRTYGLGTFRARIIFPVKEKGQEGRKFPVIVLAHGLSATSRNYLTKMRHFASHGFIVIAPESFNLFDGGDILECLPYLAGEDKTPSSSLFGIVNSNQVGLVGHSMGGAGSLAAASRVGATGSIKCVAAVHPAPLVGLGSVQVPAFISAGYNDVVTAPLPIKGTIYDSSLLKGPKLMAILRNAGHMEPVDGIGFQRWTPYLTAWFKSYLYSDLEASTLIWGQSSPQSLQLNPQMSAVHSFPGMSVTMSGSPSVIGGDFVLSAKVRNNLGRDTQYQMFYYSSKYPELESIDFKPAISPILSKGDALSFTVEATLKSNITDASQVQVFVISRDKFANGTTSSSFVASI
jgi:hypothetical protein